MDRRVRLATEANDALVAPTGLSRYVRKNIRGAPNDQALSDHARVLSYAAYFESNGAAVEFVREDDGRSADLKVAVMGYTFYLEVRHFRLAKRMPTNSASNIRKIQRTVAQNTRQLPSREIGIVAIDSHDAAIEGWSNYFHLKAALFGDTKTKVDAPTWKQPSAVIYSANLIVSDQPPPYFVWLNEHGERPIPAPLVDWILSCLPNGARLRPGRVESETQDDENAIGN